MSMTPEAFHAAIGEIAGQRYHSSRVDRTSHHGGAIVVAYAAYIEGAGWTTGYPGHLTAEAAIAEMRKLAADDPPTIAVPPNAAMCGERGSMRGALQADPVADDGEQLLRSPAGG